MTSARQRGRKAAKEAKPMPTLQPSKPKVEHSVSPHHEAHACLNCEVPLHGNFCHNCGQSASTHRYSIVSFFAHDFLHSVWHVDKSIIKSLKEVMLRPGITARHNIAGKRARYFPILTLLLLVLGLYFYLSPMSGTAPEAHSIVFGEWDLTEIWESYKKWFILATIPVIACSSWLVFRKSGYNYAEQLVVGCYALAAIFAWSCITWEAGRFIPAFAETILDYAYLAFVFVILWQAYRSHYSIAGWVWRSLLFFVVMCFIFLVLLTVLVFVFNDKTHIIRNG